MENKKSNTYNNMHKLSVSRTEFLTDLFIKKKLQNISISKLICMNQLQKISAGPSPASAMDPRIRPVSPVHLLDSVENCVRSIMIKACKR